MSDVDGPERLEVGRPPLARRTGWLVLALALAVVFGLVVVRLTGAGPAPGPGPSRSTAPGRPVAAPRGWPTGLGLTSGTLYVLGRDDVRPGDDVHAVDVAGGLVTSLGLEGVDVDHTSLTALSPGVLVWSDDGRPAQVVRYSGALPGEPAEPLRSARTVLPGPEGTVWATGAGGSRTLTGATWTLADDLGTRGPRVRLRGFAVPDGAGGLFDAERARLHHATPGARRDLGAAHVLAVGPDGTVVDRCLPSACRPFLSDRATGRVTAAGPAVPPDPERDAALVDPGALSAGNRFVAERVRSEDGVPQVRVSRVGETPQVLRSFPAGTRGTGFAWLSDRWLVATSGEGLLLYDAVDDTVLVPSLPFTGAARLAFEPA